ncbi:MAG TPA: non-homologous end-joining DNA ligase [Puia sp.]|nr:non-homologous end-joining DNA ligase [Puia sp.]
MPPTHLDKRKIPHAISPMLAREIERPFSNDHWIFETKWDGYRAIAECRGKNSLLYSRNGLSFAKRYPIIYDQLQRINQAIIIDGEIVAIDKNGKSDFQLLQQFEENPRIPIRYYVFDILSYKNEDITSWPLMKRKALLKKVLPENETVIYCSEVENDGLSFFKKVKREGLEGMMAKEKDSQYLIGQRTSFWLKVKNQHVEEAVIIGFTAPQGSRINFGSLVLGIYQKGKLVYAGHTGTGFTRKILEELYEKMHPLIDKKPALELVEKIKGEITWIKPKLVASIRFTEWTKDGIMRQPVFLGLRVDKSVQEMKTGK